MKRVSPVLLVGLGDDGAAAIRAINSVLTAERPELRPLVAVIALESNGQLRDFVSGETLSIAGLQSNVKADAFSANYEALIAAGDAMEPWIADRLASLLRQDARMALEDAGYSVDSAVRILLVAAMADHIGSSAVVPILTVLQSLLASRMRGALFETDVLGLFPDVIRKQRDSDDMYARAYTFVQELEYIAENPLVVGIEGNPPFQNVFLFSARNEEGLEVTDSDQLVNMIGEFLGSLLRREFASDSSYALALTRQLEGKTTRYSSFGLAKLVFPVEHVMEAISAHHYLSYLNSFFGKTPPKFNADLMSADVKEFVGATALDKLSTLMRTNAAGATIYTEFRYSGSSSEKVSVEVYVKALAQEAEEFSRADATKMSRALAIRRDDLLTEHLSKLGQTIVSAIDTDVKGPYYSSGFVDVLRDLPSPYIRDDGTSEHYSLAVVETNAKAFFDRLFGVDRSALARAQRDLADKRALIVERERLADKAKAERTDASLQSDAITTSLLQSIAALESEVGILESDVARRTDDLAQFDLRLSDAADRRAMLKALRGDEEADREKKVESLSAADVELKTQESRLAELYELRRRIAMKLAFVYPAILAGTVAVASALGGRLLGVGASAGLGWGIRTGLGALALYTVWAGFTYFTGIRSQIAEAELTAENLRSGKRRALLDLQAWYTQSFRTTFEHELNSGLIGWIADYKAKAAELSVRLAEFISTVERSILDRVAFVDGLAFPNTPLARSAISKTDVETIIKDNAQAAHEENSFRRSNPLSSFFAAYQQTGDLSKLQKALSRFAEEVYSHVRVQSVEMILAATTSTETKLLSKLDQLYQASQAFIQLGVEKGSDQSQSLVYVGTETDEQSRCKQLFGKVGGGPKSFYSTGNRYELTAARLKVGFPAFQVALMPYGRRIVNAGEPRRFAIDREWELVDLMPSLFTSGTADDPARRLICLGLAYRVVTVDDKRGYMFEQVELGKSLEDAAARLRSASSAKIRGQVSQKIEAQHQGEDALDKLRKCRREKGQDPIDIEILDQAIAELNPLS